MLIKEKFIEKSKKEIEIKIQLSIFMPTPATLFNYYQILKNYGYIQKFNQKIKKNAMKNKTQITNELETNLYSDYFL